MGFIIAVISIVYILFKIIAIPFQFEHIFVVEYNKGKKAMAKARSKNKQMVQTVADGLKETNNVLYYEVLDYTNKNNSLKQFVNLLLPINNEYKEVNKEVNFYLITNGAKYSLRKYFGKKKELKNTIVIADMGQMYIEEMLSKIVGKPVTMRCI